MNFQDSKPPTYILIPPFRFVKPYPHTFQTHAKQRWLGRPILSVLSEEFLAYSPEYFKYAIQAGKIRINGHPVSEDYAIRNSDFLEHQTIRFEPPIPDLPVRIISQTAQIVVVDKPPGMVVHTGGGYHNNTLLGILHFEHGLKNLFVLHRLDRLTSGLVILARVKDKTTKFHEESKGEVMKKCYFARVSGDVKFESEVVNVGMVCLSFKEGVWAVYQKETMFGLLKNQQVKDSSTKFVKVWYDEKTDSSLLECYPITGRTHQIRVHLQHIGHPILNDVVYGGRFIGNPTINNIIDNIQQNKSIEENDEDVVDKVEKRVKGLEEDSKKEKEVPNKNDHKNSLPSEYKEWYEKWEYKKRPLEIMLHSHKYTFEGTTYIGSKPYWTQPRALDALHSQALHQPIQPTQYQQIRRSAYEIDLLKKAVQQPESSLQEKTKVSGEKNSKTAENNAGKG